MTLMPWPIPGPNDPRFRNMVVVDYNDRDAGEVRTVGVKTRDTLWPYSEEPEGKMSPLHFQEPNPMSAGSAGELARAILRDLSGCPPVSALEMDAAECDRARRVANGLDRLRLIRAARDAHDEAFGLNDLADELRPCGLTAKTPAFEAGDSGSTPGGASRQ